MKVLLAASEAAPIVKFGGLGDVIGSLPKALEKQSVDVDVVVPFYTSVKLQDYILFKVGDLDIPFGGTAYDAELYKTKLPHSNVDVLMLKQDEFFAAPFVSEVRSFAFFSRAVVELIKSRFNTYDVIHCNDWHTGLITHLLEEELGLERPGTLYTIHNLLYEGIGDAGILRDLGISPGSHPSIDWDIKDGNIDLMLQGILSGDYISTVSPSYADEILKEKDGRNFAPILESRKNRLVGILNGIDYSQFVRDYNEEDVFVKKSVAKNNLGKQLHVNVGNTPLFSYISRLDPNQKGLDILYDSIPYITNNGGYVSILGTGDPYWTEKLRKLSQINSKVNFVNKFDIELANKMYEASDFILVPSKYEPCGLVQMIAMWYGSLPIGHAVGGIKDSIDNNINGFLFNEYNSNSLNEAVSRALNIYNNTQLRKSMITNALHVDLSWKKSSLEYISLYEKIIKLRE